MRKPPYCRPGVDVTQRLASANVPSRSSPAQSPLPSLPLPTRSQQKPISWRKTRAVRADVVAYSHAENATAEQKRAREARFRKSMLHVHDQIVSDTRSAPFREPVRKRDAPAYFDTIKRPMDLKTVGARVKQGLTTTVAAYRRDMLNIFANAIMFNSPYDDNEVVKQAREMAELAEMRVIDPPLARR